MTGRPAPAARWVPHRWLPRRTVRLRLTLVYGCLFLLSGAALLAITYLLVSHRLPTGPVTGGAAAPSAIPPGSVSSGRVFVPTPPGGCGPPTGPAGPPGAAGPGAGPAAARPPPPPA